MKYNSLIGLLFLIGFIGVSSAHLISDQGTNVVISNGSLLNLGNLTILLYTDSSAGNLIFNTTIQNAIVNGSWNLMINPILEYGISYWKDYEINGEDLDFDGNERIEFQSPLGYINNFSFVNLSLINSCSVGSAIRLVYSNGSVVCQSSSGGNGSTDLTNYALKNQSETFTGNITTLDRGFFGFLGSLASRIGKIFVNEIDASGNIVTSENVTADYFFGDGSLLTNLPAGTESDPIFVAENSTLWNAINLKLSQTDQRYNDTALVISMNTTSNIMSLGFYNSTQINSLISGVGNSSFNQSFTDLKYYSISNPSGFINSTQAGVYNDTALILTTNSSLWNYINSNQGSWISNYNLTYSALLGQQCSTGYIVNGTLSNGTFTCIQNTLSESDPLWSANSTSVLYIANLPLENRTISHISNITGFSFNYNQTSPAISYVTSQGFLTSSVANATYLMITDLPLENRTRIHCSNITGAVSNLCTLTSGGSVNLFDQVLNTTSNVTFESVNATREIYVSNIAVKQWLYNQTQSPYFYNQTGNFNYNQTQASPFIYNHTNVLINNNLTIGNNNLSASTGFFGFLGSLASRVTKIFAVDLDISNNLTASGNISSTFYIGSLNYSAFPTTVCSGTDKVVGVNSSGGVTCGNDQTSSSGNLPVKYISVLAAAVTDTNAPATERIVGNSQYLACTNATGYRNFRYGFARSATAGATNALVYMKYIAPPTTTIAGTSYTNLSSSMQNMIYTTANLVNVSATYSMSSNLGDVCLGAFQVGGDGVLDPQWRNIWVELS